VATRPDDRDIDRKIEKVGGEARGKQKEMQASFFFSSSEKLQRCEPIYVHKRQSSVVLVVHAPKKKKRCSIQALPITTWIILPIK